MPSPGKNPAGAHVRPHLQFSTNSLTVSNHQWSMLLLYQSYNEIPWNSVAVCSRTRDNMPGGMSPPSSLPANVAKNR